MFQSTYLYKVRRHCTIFYSIIIEFQSTYLYKVRLHVSVRDRNVTMFQSTYLYKIRRINALIRPLANSFNPRTSIRYDQKQLWHYASGNSFNPRTSIRYDMTPWSNSQWFLWKFQPTYLYKIRLNDLIESDLWHREDFNPRTSIRYDLTCKLTTPLMQISTHVPL